MVAEQQSQIQLRVEGILKEEGLDLVEFRVFYSGSKAVLRCLVDYPQGGVTIDECARINKKIFSYLEEARILGGNFTVEVNSPGMTRALKTYKDFIRVKGKTVSFWLNEPIEDKSYLEAKVLDVNDKGVSVEKDGKGIEIKFEQINLGKERL